MLRTLSKPPREPCEIWLVMSWPFESRIWAFGTPPGFAAPAVLEKLGLDVILLGADH